MFKVINKPKVIRYARQPNPVLEGLILALDNLPPTKAVQFELEKFGYKSLTSVRLALKRKGVIAHVMKHNGTYIAFNRDGGGD